MQIRIMQTPFFFSCNYFYFVQLSVRVHYVRMKLFLQYYSKKLSKSHKLRSLMSYLLLLMSVQVLDKQNSSPAAGVPSQKHLSCNPQQVMQLASRNKYFASYQQL